MQRFGRLLVGLAMGWSPAALVPGALAPAALISVTMVPAAAWAADGPSLLERLRAVSSDDDAARAAIARENPPRFRAAAESLFAATDLTDLGDEANRQFASGLAEAYAAATRDSVLVADVRFLALASPEIKNAWIHAVELDRRGIATWGEDPEGAIATFREVLGIYARIGHLRREAVAWGSLGSAWFRKDRGQAAACYRRALEKRRLLGDPLWIGRALNTLGSVAFQNDDYDSALVYYREARAVREPLGIPDDLAMTRIYIANILVRQGRLVDALAEYTGALENAGPQPSVNVAYRGREGIANATFGLGDYPAAEEAYRRALEIEESAGMKKDAANTRANLAEVRRREGDFLGALSELDAARDYQEEQEDDAGLSMTLNKIGGVLGDLGEWKRAHEAWLGARDHAERSRNRLELANAEMNLGFALTELGAPRPALDFHARALALCDSLDDPACGRDARSKLATTHEKLGDYARALALHEEVLASDRERGDADAETRDLLDIGHAKLLLGRRDDGLADMRTAAGLARSLGNPEILWPAYLNIADTFEGEGELDSAFAYNARAIEVLGGTRGRALSEETKAAFQGKRAFVYDAQVNVLAKLEDAEPGRGHAEAALAVAEEGKARAFLDMLDEAHVDLSAGAPVELVAARDRTALAAGEARYRLRESQGVGATADSLRALRDDVESREGEEERAEERLRLQDPRFAAMAPAEVAPFREMRAALLAAPRTVLLEYALGDSASYLWVATRDGLEMHRLPPRGVLEREVRALRQGIQVGEGAGRGRAIVSAGEVEDWQGPASRLYGVLLEPAASRLAGAEAVIVVPDGALHYVPFECLGPMGGGGSDAGSVLRGKAVRYGPSATSLVRLAARGRKGSGPWTCLAVGAPEFKASGTESTAVLAGSGGLAPLPFTRREVEAIGALVGAKHSRILLGDEAREAVLRQPGFVSGYRILHFATHGLVDELRPARSSLALAYPKDPSEDGYLQSAEIYRLDLNADLVVLSACETGLGRMERGEGVLGLPRAFFYAGARNVLVSLWSVSDEGTAALMTAFYRELVRGGKGPAEALARAKKSMRESERWGHPFYWAGFVLLGSGV